MTADVTKAIACYYNAEVIKWIDSLQFGVKCFNEGLLDKLEEDLFLSELNCDIKFCFDYQLEEPLCDTTLDCNITLINLETGVTCSLMTLINY